VARDGTWTLRPRTGTVRPTKVRARDLLRATARAAHDCGDPGVQFADTIERWNPVPVTGPIRATNPCAVRLPRRPPRNLASINVLAFRDPVRGVDVERLGRRSAC
jgi:ribonucleoside-diphosphate reductase alpha chain